MIMKKKLTPLAKGLITAALMIIVFYIPHFTNKQNEGNVYDYTIWGLFAGGIIWTLIDFRNSPEYVNKFGAFFKQGFRCFIVVTLAMALTLMIFYSSNTEYRDRFIAEAKVQLQNEKTANGQPKHLPGEIDTMLAAYKKYYIVGIISGTIFGYLILGSFITAAGSVILMTRKQ